MDLKESKLLQNKSLARHPWEMARLEVILTLLRQFMKKQLASGATVVDIGCGDIFVAEQLANFFPLAKFIAIDKAFDEDLLHSFKSNLQTSNVELYPSLESAVALQDKAANVVLLLDVIEHIEEDEAFLYSLYTSDMIANQAYILITVPAFQSLYCSHDTFLEHYRRYNVKKLRRVVKRAGFEVEEQGYFFTSLLLPRLIQVGKEKLIKKTIKPAQGLADWQGSPIKNLLIKQVLLIDFKLTQLLQKLGISLPGLSCYSICQKKVQNL